jgi:hypothetical protein
MLYGVVKHKDTFTFYWYYYVIIASTVNPRYNVCVIADVPYNRVKEYSRKYTIGYIDNTRNMIT